MSEACRLIGLVVWIGVSITVGVEVSTAIAGPPAEAGEGEQDAIAMADSNGESGRLTAHFNREGVEIREAGSPVLFYQRRPKSLDGKWRRTGYVHPVYDLEGRVITEDFPEDHRHHRGIFWAWHQVWVGETRLGDPWVCERFEWDVKSIRVTSPASPLILESQLHWTSPDWVNEQGEMIPVVAETVQMRVHAASEHSRSIDFDLTLRALVDDVRIGGSEDVKGYGGFSPRIQMSPAREFRDRSGLIEPTKEAVMAGPWVDLSNEVNGIAILSHPGNSTPAGDPQAAEFPWILRRSRSMQNAVYPGRIPVPLELGTVKSLKYRLVVHDGERTPEELERCFADFANSSR